MRGGNCFNLNFWRYNGGIIFLEIVLSISRTSSWIHQLYSRKSSCLTKKVYESTQHSLSPRHKHDNNTFPIHSFIASLFFALNMWFYALCFEYILASCCCWKYHNCHFTNNFFSFGIFSDSVCRLFFRLASKVINTPEKETHFDYWRACTFICTELRAGLSS